MQIDYTLQCLYEYYVIVPYALVSSVILYPRKLRGCNDGASKKLPMFTNCDNLKTN